MLFLMSIWFVLIALASTPLSLFLLQRNSTKELGYLQFKEFITTIRQGVNSKVLYFDFNSKKLELQIAKHMFWISSHDAFFSCNNFFVNPNKKSDMDDTNPIRLWNSSSLWKSYVGDDSERFEQKKFEKKCHIKLSTKLVSKIFCLHFGFRGKSDVFPKIQDSWWKLAVLFTFKRAEGEL